MIESLNDSPQCASELSSLLKGILCHVNLIPANHVKERGFSPSNVVSIKKFYDILQKNHINVTVRRTLGKDISASCGQLRLSRK
jgi:23S rRNA (adenine2503-C2)-methyltransferase